MLVIANNITTRNARVKSLFQQIKETAYDPEEAPAKALKELIRQCVEAGADCLEINTQQHHDQPEMMEFAVTMAQGVTGCQLCLSTNNVEALKAGLRACKQPPLVNHISIEEDRLDKMLPVAAQHGADVVLLISSPTATSDAEEMLKKTAILVGAANESGIPNGSILIDPGLIHVTKENGQRHFAEVMKFLQALPETFDPPVKSTCWPGNISAGAPRRLRSTLETAALMMLSGLGLTSAFIDVLRPENMRTVRLSKILRNEMIYSDQDAEP